MNFEEAVPKSTAVLLDPQPKVAATLVGDLGAAERAIYDSLGSEEQKRIMLERNVIYGSPIDSHVNIGRMWAAQLSAHFGKKIDDIPGFVVAQMLVTFKMQRGARVYHKDNYDDGANYMAFAKAMQEHGK